MKAPLFYSVRIVVCLAFSVLTDSCKLIDPAPAPTADFTVNFIDEGVVTFNLTTTNADSFTWDFGDGKSSSDKVPTHQYESNGTYIVNVTVKGKGGEKVVTRTIKITDITGTVMFWMRTMYSQSVSVYVDGRYWGKITGYYQSGIAPSCGATYCVTVSGLAEGKHYFKAEESGFSPSTWSSSFNIIGNECSKQQLVY